MKPDMNALVPRDTDSSLERIKKHLLRARAYLPAEDDFLVKRAEQIRDKNAKKLGLSNDLVSVHLTEAGAWSFYEFVEINQPVLAWDELAWAAERYAAMIAIGGGNLPCFKEWPDPYDIGANRAAFWHSMALAAREMAHGQAP